MEKFKIVTLLFVALIFIIINTNLNKYKIQPVFSNKATYSGTHQKVSSIDNKISKSVIKIDMYLQTFGIYKHEASATGFSVKYDKKSNSTYFITNHHVCVVVMENPGSLVYVKPTDVLPNYTPNADRVMEIIATDPDNDLCLIKANNEKIEPLNFKPSAKLKKFEDIYSIGAPGDVYPIWIHGKYSGNIDRDIESFGFPKEGYDFLLLSAIITGGQSGSPVYTGDGKVVGVIFIKLGLYGGSAIPSEAVIEFLKDKV